jgi:chromosome segregation ATPase
MKNFQQNLLIVLALGLCALCAFQWYGQTRQRDRIESLNGVLFGKDKDIQSYTNSIATMNQQITEMDSHLTKLRQTVRTDARLIVAQKRDLSRLEIENEMMTNQIAQYTNAVNTLEARLKEAYTGIEKQNAAITNLVAQRDQFVKKYNDEIKDRNNIVAKYNDLVKQVEKPQGGGQNSTGK